VRGCAGVCEGVRGKGVAVCHHLHVHVHLARLLLALVLEDDVLAVGHPLSRVSRREVGGERGVSGGLG